MADEKVYKIVSGNTVTVVSGTNVTDAAAKVGASPMDPNTTITSLTTGCKQPTLSEAKKKYEKNPVSDYGYKAPDKDTKPSEPKTREKDTTPSRSKSRDDTEPAALQPATITGYQFTLPNGKVRTFEAMTQDEAEHNVKKWGAELDTLQITGERGLSQHEITESLRGAASRSDMDYARALIKYEQVEGVVPVRDGKTGDAMLISEADWNALAPDHKKIVTTKGLDELNKVIYDSLPEQYQIIADKKDLEAALAVYGGDIERANEIIERLEPYKVYRYGKDDSYDIVTPLQLGVVNADDLKVAGFDPKQVKGVDKYVNKLSGMIDKWDKYIGKLKEGIDKYGDQDPQTAGLQMAKHTASIAPAGELHDFYNAITESGAIKKYGLGGTLAELESLPRVDLLVDKWKNTITLEDKYNIAEIYAAYPAPNRLLAAGYRGMIAEAPDMASAARVVKQFTLGGAAATINPFVKEQIKDSLQTILAPYKEKGGYNITAFLKDFPEDAALLARGGIELEKLEKAIDGKVKVLTDVKGATSKDWAVAGLIVVAVGAGGASLLVTQPAKSALVAASGLSQLGLGTYATIDTVKYWRQMDNTQRGIAIAFDVLLLTSGALATKGGLRGFKHHLGWLKLRNRIKYNYRAARNIIKKLLPNSKKAEFILHDFDRAIKTGDVKLLQAAAKQLQLEAAKAPKQLADPLIQRAKLLQAAPDDYIQLGKKPKAPQDLINSIKNHEAFIRNAERALKRVKDPKRYNTVRQALEKAMLDREKLLTRVKTKETTTVSPFQRVIWDRQAGKYLPAKIPAKTTTAITKYKPPVKAPTKAPDSITAGAKAKPIPIEDLRKLSPSRVAQKHFVSIWDISTALRKLPKGVQEEIALYSPEWAIVVKTKGATAIATQTALTRNLRRQQERQQKTKPALEPFPATQPQPQPQLRAAQQRQQAKKLKEQEALAIYPFFNIPQDVKTRYKRRMRRLSSGDDGIDISERLPRDRKGIQTWKQGAFFVTGFPPYRPQDFIYTKKRPHYAETSKGRRSPQRTVKAVGGKVPHLITLPMGLFTAKVKGGDLLTFSPRSRRRYKGRRRGRLVY